jgi:hypothetical protein
MSAASDVLPQCLDSGTRAAAGPGAQYFIARLYLACILLLQNP